MHATTRKFLFLALFSALLLIPSTARAQGGLDPLPDPPTGDDLPWQYFTPADWTGQNYGVLLSGRTVSDTNRFFNLRELQPAYTPVDWTAWNAPPEITELVAPGPLHNPQDWSAFFQAFGQAGSYVDTEYHPAKYNPPTYDPEAAKLALDLSRDIALKLLEKSWPLAKRLSGVLSVLSIETSLNLERLPSVDDYFPHGGPTSLPHPLSLAGGTPWSLPTLTQPVFTQADYERMWADLPVGPVSDLDQWLIPNLRLPYGSTDYQRLSSYFQGLGDFAAQNLAKYNIHVPNSTLNWSQPNLDYATLITPSTSPLDLDIDLPDYSVQPLDLSSPSLPGYDLDIPSFTPSDFSPSDFSPSDFSPSNLLPPGFDPANYSVSPSNSTFNWSNIQAPTFNPPTWQMPEIKPPSINLPSWP